MCSCNNHLVLISSKETVAPIFDKMEKSNEVINYISQSGLIIVG